MSWSMGSGRDWAMGWATAEPDLALEVRMGLWPLLWKVRGLAVLNSN